MNAEWNVISQKADEWWLHLYSSGELRCTKNEMDMIRFKGWGLLPHCTLTINCTLLSWLDFCWAYNILNLQNCLMLKISLHMVFSHSSCGGLDIYLVRLEWILPSPHRELGHLSVSTVEGWVVVASHLLESLIRVCPLGFSLTSCSSVDRAWYCRWHLKIWKHCSKHSAQLLSVKWGY
jgi:hypothetical protein